MRLVRPGIVGAAVLLALHVFMLAGLDIGHPSPATIAVTADRGQAHDTATVALPTRGHCMAVACLAVLAGLLLSYVISAVTRRRQPLAIKPPAAPVMTPPTRRRSRLGSPGLGRRAAFRSRCSRSLDLGVDLTMRWVLITLAAVLLAACAPSTATQSTASTAATFNDADVRFLQDMIPHHRQAMEMAELVDGRTRRPELVKLAAGITASRGAEIRTMQGFLTRWNQSPPAVRAADHQSQVPGMLGQGQLDWLQTLEGAQFDLGFATMMRTHHGGALELAEAELGAGAAPAVKALAEQMIAAQQTEVRQLQRWKDAWA